MFYLVKNCIKVNHTLEIKVSVVISSYNYGIFLVECIQSVLNNDYKNIEIIIVDDGSNDGSNELLNDNFSNVKNIIIIKKENGGQLSVFNEAIKHISGDIICFLDADDLYKPNYISTIVNLYRSVPECDFLIVRKEYFGLENYIEAPISNNMDLGYSIFSTYYLKEYVGSSTSTISMKKEILLKILPLYEFEKDWKVRADDCLVWGSSLVGARKFYLNEVLVSYRIHGKNNHYSKRYPLDYCIKRIINIEKFFDYIIFKNKISLSKQVFFLEFLSRLKSEKSISLFLKYLKILIFTDFKLVEKVVLITKMIRMLLLNKDKYIKGYDC